MTVGHVLQTVAISMITTLLTLVAMEWMARRGKP